MEEREERSEIGQADPPGTLSKYKGFERSRGHPHRLPFSRCPPQDSMNLSWGMNRILSNSGLLLGPANPPRPLLTHHSPLYSTSCHQQGALSVLPSLARIPLNSAAHLQQQKEGSSWDQEEAVRHPEHQPATCSSFYSPQIALSCPPLPGPYSL